MKKILIIVSILLFFQKNIFSALADMNYLTDISFIQKVIKLVKEEYVKEDIEDKKIIYGAVKGILKELNDPYSRFLDAEHLRSLREETGGEFGGIGIVIAIKDGRLTIVSPLEGTPAHKAGIKPGDIILKIDETFVENINSAEAMDMLRGNIGSKVTLLIRSEDSELSREIVLYRDSIKISSISESGVIKDNIGYIRISNFSENTHKDLKKELQWMLDENIYGLILDLRGNPGGLLMAAVEAAELFIDNGKIVSLQSKGGKNLEYSSNREAFFKKPMVIMINKGSASASEILAGALKDNKRCLIIGQRSFGKGVVQSIINLDDGSAIALTTSYYYTPSGKCIHNIGIEPDIKVEIPNADTISEKELNKEKQRMKDLEEKNIVERNKGKHVNINISIYDTQLQRAYDILRAVSILNNK